MNTVNKYFECDCSDFDHIFRISYFKDDQDYLYLHIHLRRHSFFRRMWTAIKYVFGHGSKYGDFDEILLNKDTSKEFMAVIQEFIDGE